MVPDLIADCQTAPAVEERKLGPISYPPSFFAGSQAFNALEMVQRLPGFVIEAGDAVRGFEGGAGNVLIDGVRPATKTDSLSEILRRIPAARVARIDLIRGGAPGVEMQGKAVVANVILSRDNASRSVFGVSGRWSDNGWHASGALAEHSATWAGQTLELGAFVEGYFQDLGAGAGRRVQRDPGGGERLRSQLKADGESRVVNGTAAFERNLLGGATRLNIRLYSNEYEFKEHADVEFPQPGLNLTDNSNDVYQAELGIRHSRPIFHGARLDAIGLTQVKEEYSGSDLRSDSRSEQFRLTSNTGETIGRATVKFETQPQHAWEVGAEAAYNWLDSSTTYTVNGLAVLLPAANVRVTELRSEAFAKTVRPLTGRLSAEASLRVEGSRITSQGDVDLERTLYFIKPAAAVTWNIFDDTQLRLRIERYVDQLRFADFVASSQLNNGVVLAGNPSLEPQQTLRGSLTLERRFWRDGVVAVTGRRLQLTDVVDRVPIVGPSGVFDAPGNIGDGTRDELALDLTLPLAPLGAAGAQLKAQGVYRRSEVTDPTTGQPRRISNVRPEWSVSYRHDLPQWRLVYGVDVRGGYDETFYRFDSIATTHRDAYVSAYLEWKPRKDISIRTELGNITETEQRFTRFAYGGPRSSSGLQLIDERSVAAGRTLYLRIQKRNGG